MELAAERMSRGWCVGDRAFKADMKRAGVERGADFERFAGMEPEAVRQQRTEQWDERLEAMARAASVAGATAGHRKAGLGQSIRAPMDAQLEGKSRNGRTRVKIQDLTAFGLGLSIGKWIVKFHRRTMDVESTAGKGSACAVHLPPA